MEVVISSETFKLDFSGELTGKDVVAGENTKPMEGKTVFRCFWLRNSESASCSTIREIRLFQVPWIPLLEASESCPWDRRTHISLPSSSQYVAAIPNFIFNFFFDFNFEPCTTRQSIFSNCHLGASELSCMCCKAWVGVCYSLWYRMPFLHLDYHMR